ncbi:MAG: protein kinase [Ardenticatenaceae bacterium]|nr:protein kinase [Ardenticatenaceae bacterium]
MDTEKFIGQQIDRYHIISHIARGGMADVYLAEDIYLKRKVALKVMLDTLSIDPQYVERFRREAQTVAKLDHNNIVQVYSTGLTPTQQPFLAMQFVDGGSLEDKLEQLLQRGKLLTTEQSLNIARQIALALAQAHTVHIVHRDLKPSNVLIRPDGTPVLVDLGIAVATDSTKLTQTGSLIGTPHYMSPEQVRGLPLDGRSDLYSLGIILYEMLAGVRPFEAPEPIAVLHKQAYENPIPLEKYRTDLSPQTLHVVEKAMQKDPMQRFQRAEDMIMAIDHALQAEGVAAPNPQVTAVLTQMDDASLISRQHYLRIPTGAQQPQRPVPTWAIIAAAVLVTAVLLFFVFRGRGGGPAVDTPDTASVRSEFITAEVVYVTAIVTETPEPTAEEVAPPVEEAAAEGVPTDTAVPTPTTEPTIAPTPTLLPTSTPFPTAVPTNIPAAPTACTIAVFSPFAATWDANSAQLGCPKAAGKSGIGLAQEAFEGGRMIWREDNDRIYVIYSGNSWASYADIWQEGDPDFACGAQESPPTPIRGFGKIWCAYDVVRSGLGNAAEGEWGDSASAQDFNGGTILQVGNGRIYVLYSNGVWR